MDLSYGHLSVFLFIALPLIVTVFVLITFFYRSYKFQKKLKAQSDALFKKLEKR